MTREEYQSSFRVFRKGALKEALDARKFEIALYWKRTQYFWAIIAATFAGYAVLVSSSKESSTNDESYLAQFALVCLGVVFSLGWYLVNRGSKYWQTNWERHVTLLEDDIIGPLFKTRRTEEDLSWWKLNGAYRFSVSKVNQFVSLFVFIFWLLLFLRYVLASFKILVLCADHDWTIVFMGSWTVVIIICLLFFSRGGTKDNGGPTMPA